MADPKCVFCGGSGWKILEKDGLSAAEKCSCDHADRMARIEQRANLPPLYQGAALDNFSTFHENQKSELALRQVMQIVRGWARDYPVVEPRGLLFIGSPGVGKTHLAVAALRRLLERGFAGVFFDYQSLLTSIRSSYDPLSGQADREALRTAMDSEILLLDDLGAHRVTDFVEDTVTALVTHRCNHRLSLIATTNLVDSDAGFSAGDRDQTSGGGVSYRTTLSDRIGSRARSRLFEMCKIIRMPEIGDYRLRRQNRAS